MSDPTRRTIRTTVTCVTFDLTLDAPASFTLELADASVSNVSSNIGEAALEGYRLIRERAEREFDLTSLDGARLPRSLPPLVVQLAVEDNGDEVDPVRRVVGVQVGEGPWLTNCVLDRVVRGGRR